MNLEELILRVVLPVLFVTAVLVVIRLVRGPSLPDRVVAMDLLTVIGICIMAAYAIAMDKPVYLDVAVVLALVSFLGTIAFAYYIDRRA